MKQKQIYVNSQGDNSMLFLLYGIITVLVVVLFVLLWRMNVKSAYQVQRQKEQKKHINSFMDDMYDLFDQKIHRTLLFLPTVCVIAFTILPLIFMMSMAFTNYDRNHQPPWTAFLLGRNEKFW